MNLPASAPLPVAPILAEVARLHWNHILVFLAAAALYAVPVSLVLAPLADTLIEAQTVQAPTPALLERMTLQSFYVLLVFPVLSGALFWFWVRLTLMGPRAGWRNDGPGRALLAVLQLAGLMVLLLVAAVIGVLPVALLLGMLGQSPLFQALTFLIVTFAACFAFAVFSPRLVETALEVPRGQAMSRPPPRMEQHLRLAALFAAAAFALFAAQAIVSLVLAGLGATLSSMVASGILSTATITVYASIHAIVYRLRTVPPVQP